jgi:hypothetical protein
MELWLQLGLLNQSRMMYKIIEHDVMIIGKGRSKDLKKTCPSASLFSTNPTWTAQALNQVLHVRGWWPAARAMA